MFFWVIRRDLLLAIRRRADILTTLIFFVIVVSLFPLAVGPEMKLLRTMAPGIVWVAAFLATLLSLDRIFSSDYADGTLEQMLLSPQSLSLMVLGKALAHWITTGVPLSLIAPVIGIQYGLTFDAMGILGVSLLLGTPILSLIGTIGAALTVGLRGGGVLVSLLVLPLYVPVLIFGTGAAEAETAGLSVAPYFSLLGAFLLTSSVLVPWTTAAILRISLE